LNRYYVVPCGRLVHVSGPVLLCSGVESLREPIENSLQSCAAGISIQLWPKNFVKVLILACSISKACVICGGRHVSFYSDLRVILEIRDRQESLLSFLFRLGKGNAAIDSLRVFQAGETLLNELATGASIV
jgi:hypothetical protein